MEKIRLECSACEAKLAVPAMASGRKIRCPKCGEEIAVEAPGGGLELDFKDPAPLPPDVAPGLLEGEAPVQGARPARSDRVLSAQILEQRPRKGFGRSLDSVFAYPFSNLGSILFLLLFPPFFVMAWIFPFGFFMWLPRIVLGGYVAAYLFSILYDTSMGKDKAPGAPPLDFEELFGNFGRFFGASIVAYAPAIGLMLYGEFASETRWGESGIETVGPFSNPLFLAMLLGSGIFGTVYYPMALMIIGFAESWIAGFNYALGIRSILRIPLNYLLCLLFFIGTNVIFVLLWIFWVSTAVAAGGFGGLFLSLYVTSVALCYLFAVQMRALGLLYLTNKEKLGWFR